MDILDLLQRPEGKTLEFKRDLSSPDGVLRGIVAFANTACPRSLDRRILVKHSNLHGAGPTASSMVRTYRPKSRSG